MKRMILPVIASLGLAHPSLAQDHPGSAALKTVQSATLSATVVPNVLVMLVRRTLVIAPAAWWEEWKTAWSRIASSSNALSMGAWQRPVVHAVRRRSALPLRSIVAAGLPSVTAAR